MPVNILMPQMGESITEGTIVRWFKAEGEQVRKDEPLLEISTDKVDAEVPSPATGVLSAIQHGPGETVPVETVIGVIAGEGEETAAAPKAQAVAPAAAPAQPTAAKPEPPAELFELDEEPRREEPVVHIEVAAPPRPAVGEGDSEVLRKRSSPLVRRIAAEHGLDLSQVPGTGIAGRVTKADVEAYLAKPQAAVPAPRPTAAPSPAPPASGPQTAPPPPPPGPFPTRPFEGDELREPLSIMRQRIAEHMVSSKHTSPHVYTLFEVDVSRILAMRGRQKDEFERQHGIKLTVTPFFLKAAVEALKAFPVVNASLDGSDIVFHRHVNLGVAVAVPSGLIVPVVKHAEDLSIIGLQRAVTDLATRARSKKLMPEEVHGATFSVTNPGQFGGLVGLPIINQPNVGILSIGNVQRRPLVVTDDDGREAIAIRDVVFLALSFDHRLVDGAIADQFMAHLKGVLEAGRFELG